MFIIEREITQSIALTRSEVIEMLTEHNVTLGKSVGATMEELENSMLASLLQTVIFEDHDGILGEVEHRLHESSPVADEADITVRVER
ncbi:hypothetical protein SEA_BRUTONGASTER_145 [Gordonia phage BrutonGaster]|uniref:Uncharacterized protein n=1 Tax=Gordonia phage BrutonGaster TaxID=2530116 RepID=A0A482JLR3_9CAUD|nr:hypothetical protein HOV26_gp037 [Gordonia phage BrutonGaster]QBP33359.1 hypothetical protein SEA_BRUTONGASTER_145 [Gordonia phage BrutonGaster]